MLPIAVRLSCWRTLGISLYPFHVPQESKRLRISYCRPNIGTRNEARRPPPSTHPFAESQLQALVEAILLTGLCSATQLLRIRRWLTEYLRPDGICRFGVGLQ